MKQILTSESVGAGHPDKMCDAISDYILDAALAQDENSRVACETWVKDNAVGVIGEITTNAIINYEQIVRRYVKEIGYKDASWGIDPDSLILIPIIGKQSSEIAQGVDEEADHEQGAGDQGTMWGYATDETKELMPLPLVLSHKLVQAVAELKGTLTYLRPDCKSQVAVVYEDGKPVKIHNVVMAVQHDETISEDDLKQEVIKHIIKPICGEYLDADSEIIINGTGRFEIGGPKGDAGLTGRKIIVDTYGGIGRHGGGAFSGKDPSKVDRSAAYLARYIAKNVVASGIAKTCEVQLSYCIGVAKPTSLYVNTFGTGTVDDATLTKAVSEIFPLKPADMVRELKLTRPQGWSYAQTAVYGHFGRDIFPWEKTDRAEKLKLAVTQKPVEQVRPSNPAPATSASTTMI
ncbi:MAG: S-adenosylmethionine synthetase [Candidatus Woesearchaeota archaeon]|jgi:S-adenosylmethionine synthetase